LIFLFDCTFQIELLATLNQGLWLAGSVFIIIAAIKIIWLAWAFKLKLATEFYSIPILGLIGIVGTSILLSTGEFDRGVIHLLATWYLATLIAIVLWKRPKASCSIPLDHWGTVVFSRAIKTAWIVWGVLYFIHLFSLSIIYDLRFSLSHIVPFLIVYSFFSSQEKWSWFSAISAIIAGYVDGYTIVPVAILIAFTFILNGWKTRNYRLWTGAIIALYIASRSINIQQWQLTETNLILNIGTVIILFFMAWRLKLSSAGIFALFLVLITLRDLNWRIGSLGWGIILMITGFISLITGIIVNLKRTNIIEKS
ncbi:MAG: hypothetical protein AB1489_39475, partial [Acidobacteriota bacterium]